MSNIKDGGPAFPVTLTDGQSYNGHMQHDGMTMRDYFAAKAMQGMLANSTNHSLEDYANTAYFMADVMLSRRDK